MSNPDWIRWYPTKWLSGVLHLTNEQRGVYIQVINVIYDLGSCDADPKYVGKLCNLRSHCAKRVVDELLAAGKLLQTGSKLHQNRAETELKLARKLTEKGRLMAAKRHGTKYLESAASTCKPQPQPESSKSPIPKDSESITDSSPDTSTVPSACPKARRKRLEYPAAFQQFWLAYPQRGTDTKASAFNAWDKARKAGTDLADLQAGAERYAEHVARTGCESAHVQTWINREGWTASHANKGNGHAHGTGAYQGGGYGASRGQPTGFAAAAARAVSRAKASDDDRS